MTLIEYVSLPGMSYRQLASKVGVSGVQLWRIANGQRDASMPVARAIEDATNGLVSVAEIAAVRSRKETNSAA